MDARTARRGFTLVELLVAITIFLILTGLTIAMVNNTFESERIRSASRQVHSYLEGARDRAIYAGEPRGIRLLYEGTPGGTEPLDFAVTGMVYIKQLDPATGIDATIEQDAMGDYTIVSLSPGFDWDTAIANRVISVPGAKLILSLGRESGPTKDVGRPYTIASYDSGTKKFTISEPYLGDTSTGGPQTGRYFELELLNGILPNAEPVRLPEGILLHLTAAANKLPDNWGPPVGIPLNQGSMDLMFSPRGTILGAPGAKGIVNLVLCDVEDCPAGGSADEVSAYFTSRNEGDFLALEGGLRYVTIFTRTGQVSSHQIDPTTGGDPFEFSLTGEVSGE